MASDVKYYMDEHVPPETFLPTPLKKAAQNPILS
jgi:hypothetical protein